MAKTATIRARTEPKLKEQAEQVLERLGVTPTQVITMLYKRIVMEQGLPFEAKIPNEETRDAIEDSRQGKNLQKFQTKEDMFKSLDD